MSNTGRIAIDDNAVIRKKLPKLWAQYTECCTSIGRNNHDFRGFVL